MKRNALLLVALGLAVMALAAVALRSPPPGKRVAALSLLALGDTGQPIGGPLAALRPQHRVARALVAEDERAPIDGLVLLGDNFYPDGLEEDELKDRLRVNIVAPYCRFLRFTARGRGSLEGECGVRQAARHPVPLFAVLGNHDYGERESPMLQKELVPEYIDSWRMPDRAEVFELPGGVSLIPFQSVPTMVGKAKGTAALEKALQRSKGPWRILAAHHPIADPGNGHADAYARRVRAAIARAGVPVHLFLAGHEHNLQAIEGEGGRDDAALHVVAGSGSDTRKVRGTPRKRLFGVEALGFARIDAEATRLRVSLFRVPATPGTRAVVEARFEIDAEGKVRREP
ncbi:MAG: metallophosphoesterase [Planctomycetota bacterium]|nr:metallophosphoesterase [Planctomycetota bacterium]